MKYNNQDIIKLIPNATFINGQKIPETIINGTIYVRGTDLGGNYIISNSSTGSVLGTIRANMISKEQPISPASPMFRPYLIQILNYTSRKSAPSDIASDIGACDKGEIYTIMNEQNGWGQLKANLGWIKLQYTKRI